MNVLEILEDKIQGKAPKGARRSSKWSKLRNELVAEAIRSKKGCECCGSMTKLRVHHVISFWIAPHLELVRSNLKVLCQNKKYGINCHLLLGHVGNFRRINPSCELDIMIWNKKLSV